MLYVEHSLLRNDEVDTPSISKGAFRKPFEIDDADARSLAEIKRRRIYDTLSIYFDVATTQMRRIFSKGNYMTILTNLFRTTITFLGCLSPRKRCAPSVFKAIASSSSLGKSIAA